MSIVVISDSHGDVFNYIKDINKIDMCVIIVPGATAQGAVNPNSKTNALKIFESELKKIKKIDKIFVMLGEVDCGFLIWLRSMKYNISVEEQIEQSLKNLSHFINDILIGKFKIEKNNIIMIGSILPTIKDNTEKRYLNGARSEVTVPQVDRTKKTIEYNDKLKAICRSKNIHYIDITKETISENGLIDDNFLNEDPYNHHLSNEKTHNIWLRKIKRFI